MDNNFGGCRAYCFGDRIEFRFGSSSYSAAVVRLGSDGLPSLVEFTEGAEGIGNSRGASSVPAGYKPVGLDRYWLTEDKSYYSAGSFRLVSRPTNVNNTMPKLSIMQKAALYFVSEPFKTFRKFALTDADNNLTADGTKLFLQFLLTREQEAFKTFVDALAAEGEVEEKK